MRGFETGSRVYGIPRPDSDYDLVILGNEREYQFLLSLQDQHDGCILREHEALYPSCSIYIGELNVIFCRSRWQYFKWWLAMKICKLCGPLSREDCVRVHKKII